MSFVTWGCSNHRNLKKKAGRGEPGRNLQVPYQIFHKKKKRSRCLQYRTVYDVHAREEYNFISFCFMKCSRSYDRLVI